MSGQLNHIPVLADQVVDLLQPQLGQVFVDCTAGLGGHALLVAERLGESGVVVLNDMDGGNLLRAEEAVRLVLNPGDPGSANVIAIQGNFNQLPARLRDLGVVADMVLADLGFASTQVDDPMRGMSFRHSGPLDMRMDQSMPIDAAELVNTLPEEDLARLIREFGEERHARRIASKIVEARGDGPMETTDQLADLIGLAIPGPRGSIHPATRTFQALRIAVNDELGSLESLLRHTSVGARKAYLGKEGGWLGVGARIAIIAFHSLEDRPVKKAFASMQGDGHVELITRKPVGAETQEIGRNPRSRSAKMRAVRVLGLQAE